MSEVVRIKMAIDPGWSGAIAIQCNDKLITHNCPETPKEIYELVWNAKNLSIENRPGNVFWVSYEAVLEKVHSMPGMNCAAVWTFAQNFSYWQMALIVNKVSFKEITPQCWMKKFGGVPKDKKERKNYIKDQMQKRYPQLNVNLKNADALGLLSLFDQLWGENV